MEQKSTRHKGKHLLVIEDEEMVGDILKIILEEAGYAVTLVSTGVEGLKSFRLNEPAIDLVITDQVMPGMSGFDVAMECKKIRAEVPVIMCSGSYPFNFPDYNALGIDAYVMKPFTFELLVRTVGRVLDEKDRLADLAANVEFGRSVN